MKSIAAIGMFDGVHLGHRAILSALVEKGAETNRRPIVFTFDTHPRETLTGEAMPLITPPDLKRELIEEAFGLPVNVMNFSKADFAMPAATFLQRLRELYGVEALVMGYDNRIGSDHLDGRSLVGDLGAEVYTVGRVTAGDYQPSSSAIRNAVSAGDIAAVRAMLGHEYTVRGKVVEGNRVGRTIGFPTANIELSDPRQLLPPDGAYVVDVHLDGSTLRGMANTGMRPTLDDGRGKTLEVNIFDYDGDLYGRTLDIDILDCLRPEKAFPTLAALKAQLAHDRAAARAWGE